MTTDVIGDLIRRVEALEALSPGEELSANYLTINPANGQVGANFSGLINAAGLILNPSEGVSPATVNQIQWVRASDGALVASIGSEYGQGGADSTFLFVNAKPETLAGGVNLSLNATQPTGGTSAALLSLNMTPGNAQATLAAEGGAGNTSQVIAQTSWGSRVLLDGSGNSGYAVAGGGNSQPFHLRTGAATVTWPGGASASNITNITPGSPFVGGASCLTSMIGPVSAFASSVFSAVYAGGNPATWSIQANFSSGGAPGAGTQETCYWLEVAF